MYLGKIVEIGPAEEIYENPRHPYTQALLRAIPDPDPERTVPRDLPRGEVPDAITPPLGCSFHPRCPKAFEVCGWESRDLRNMLETRWTELDEDAYQAERKQVGNLDRLDEPAPEAVLPAGTGHSGETPRRCSTSCAPPIRTTRSGAGSLSSGSSGTASTCAFTIRSTRATWRSTGAASSATSTTPKRWRPPNARERTPERRSTAGCGRSTRRYSTMRPWRIVFSLRTRGSVNCNR